MRFPTRRNSALAEAEIQEEGLWLRPRVPNIGMQTEARFLGLPESDCEAGEAESGGLLAAQVSRYIRNVVAVARCRSADGSVVAWSLGHRIDHAVFETVSQSTRPGEGERDFHIKR